VALAVATGTKLETIPVRRPVRISRTGRSPCCERQLGEEVGMTVKKTLLERVKELRLLIALACGAAESAFKC
jgi:hypothetical protein